MCGAYREGAKEAVRTWREWKKARRCEQQRYANHGRSATTTHLHTETGSSDASSVPLSLLLSHPLRLPAHSRPSSPCTSPNSICCWSMVNNSKSTQDKTRTRPKAPLVCRLWSFVSFSFLFVRRCHRCRRCRRCRLGVCVRRCCCGASFRPSFVVGIFSRWKTWHQTRSRECQ